jgi:hypothetical protein
VLGSEIQNKSPLRLRPSPDWFDTTGIGFLPENNCGSLATRRRGDHIPDISCACRSAQLSFWVARTGCSHSGVHYPARGIGSCEFACFQALKTPGPNNCTRVFVLPCPLNMACAARASTSQNITVNNQFLPCSRPRNLIQTPALPPAKLPTNGFTVGFRWNSCVAWRVWVGQFRFKHFPHENQLKV